jgi:hypothetical protein
MNIEQILGTMAQLVGSGVGTFLITEIVKKIKLIPIGEGQKVRLRSLSGGLSVISVLLLGFVNQDLKPDDVQGSIVALIGALATWGVSHGTYKTLKISKNDI